MASPPERRRAARHHQPSAAASGTSRRGPSAGRKQPITVDAIVDSAFVIVERDGYDALTMRRVAAALETGPASLYAHVVNKTDLDELMIGRLCATIRFPEPDSQSWREQIVDVCTQLRDQILRYPGISRAALANAPTNLETLHVSEGMLALMLAGGIEPRSAAWTVDALLLYINAFCLEVALRDRQTDTGDPAARLAALPDSFPNTRRHAGVVASGSPSERFAFTVDLILDGLHVGDR